MPEHDCLPPDVSATEFVTHMARMSGPAAHRRPRAHGRGAAPRGPVRGALPPDRRLLHRHEAARQARPGPGPRPRAAAARRADQRPGPGRPRRDARPDQADRHRVRHLDRGRLAPARRDRAGLRLPGGHRRRPAAALGPDCDFTRRTAACWRSRSRRAPSGWPRALQSRGVKAPRRRTAACPGRPRGRRASTTRSATRSPTWVCRWSGSRRSAATVWRTSSGEPGASRGRQAVSAVDGTAVDAPARRASTTWATATTKASGSAARYAIRSLYVESLRGICGLRPVGTRAKAAPFILLGLYSLFARHAAGLLALIAAMAPGEDVVEPASPTTPTSTIVPIFVVLFCVAQAPSWSCRDQRYQRAAAVLLRARCTAPTTSLAKLGALAHRAVHPADGADGRPLRRRRADGEGRARQALSDELAARPSPAVPGLHC